MERPTALWLCSITVLLGTALLLSAPRSTQALSNIREKDPLAAEQDLAKESILDVAVELPEEGKISEEEKPGIKVFSSNDGPLQGPHQVQVGPEEDRDHLHHYEDDARKVDAHGPPQMLSLKVQNGPEEDLDHVYHS